MLHFTSSFRDSNEARFKCFGTECLIRVGLSNATKREALLVKGVREAERIEAKYSRFLPTSEITRINNAAFHTDCPIDFETYAILALAKLCFEESDGLFDVTAAPLLELWSKASRLPSSEEIRATCELVGFNKIEFSPASIRFRNAGIKLDFGGLGKEYAVDRVFDLLCADSSELLVNFGGDLRVQSENEINIGIQHPSDPAKILASLPITSAAIATSGSYARGRLIDGNLYSHIVNPISGMPASYFSSVTVCHHSATLAGVATTTASLLEERGESYLNAAELRYLAATSAGRILQS